jgi:hypothetical protein
MLILAEGGKPERINNSHDTETGNQTWAMHSGERQALAFNVMSKTLYLVSSLQITAIGMSKLLILESFSNKFCLLYTFIRENCVYLTFKLERIELI